MTNVIKSHFNVVFLSGINSCEGRTSIGTNFSQKFKLSQRVVHVNEQVLEAVVHRCS